MDMTTKFSDLDNRIKKLEDEPITLNPNELIEYQKYMLNK